MTPIGHPHRIEQLCRILGAPERIMCMAVSRFDQVGWMRSTSAASRETCFTSTDILALERHLIKRCGAFAACAKVPIGHGCVGAALGLCTVHPGERVICECIFREKADSSLPF